MISYGISLCLSDLLPQFTRICKDTSSVGKKKSTCSEGYPSSISGLGRSSREGIRYPLQYSWVSLVAQVKLSACNVGNLDSIPGLGRSPGGEKGYPLQYSGLENSKDCIVHGVVKSHTQLSNFHTHTMRAAPGNEGRAMKQICR